MSDDVRVGIKNWEKFQHYKHRQPSWIKMYRALLDDPEWFALDGESAKFLIMCWLVASENGGYLPASKKLAFRLRTTEENCNAMINKLNHWLDSTPLAGCNQGACSDTDSDTDKKKKDQEEAEPELVLLPEKHLTVEGAKQLWNAIPGIKPCKELGGALKIKITKLVKEHPASWWLKFFAEIEKSNFLCGRSKPRDDRKPFKADLDWVTGPINLGKILSGKYDDGTRAIIPKAVQVDQEKPGIPPPKEVADRLRRVGIKIPGVTTGEGHA